MVGRLELRRAILLFAIVLGLAAVATSVSRPTATTESEAQRASAGPQSTPTARPQPDPMRVEIKFETSRAAEMRTLSVGRAATVTVETVRPGLVEIGDSGLNAPAERLTPARFDVLFAEPDRFPILFTRTGAAKARKVGMLKVKG